MSIINTKQQNGFLQFSVLEQVDQNQLAEWAPRNTSSIASVCYHQTKQGEDEDSLISTNSGVKYYAGSGPFLSLFTSVKISLLFKWFINLSIPPLHFILCLCSFHHSPHLLSAADTRKARQIDPIHFKGGVACHGGKNTADGAKVSNSAWWHWRISTGC